MRAAGLAIPPDRVDAVIEFDEDARAGIKQHGGANHSGNPTALEKILRGKALNALQLLRRHDRAERVENHLLGHQLADERAGEGEAYTADRADAGHGIARQTRGGSA